MDTSLNVTTTNRRALSKDETDFLKAEYVALRAEILKRMEIQHQLVSGALVVTGAFLTVGFSNTATLFLAYPIFALFIAVAWAQNDIRIRQMGLYIRERIEDNLLGEGRGWEHIGASSKLSSAGTLGSLSRLASRGTLIGTQLLVVLISLLKTSFPMEDIVLLVIDGIVIALTMLVLRRHTVYLMKTDKVSNRAGK
jgi:hypothetical protein